MPKVALWNQAGSQVGDIELNDSVFGITPNEQALYDVVKAQRAAMRQGTHSTKTRGMVRGGGKKPWRQKGTGRARAGTNTSPLWNGGGIVFGPSPRSYKIKVNKKVRRLALKSVLSGKLADGELKIIDSLSLDHVKTKDMVAVFSGLEVEGKVALVLGQPNEIVQLSARNIAGVKVTSVSHASVYELLNAKYLVLTAEAAKQYEEVLG
jgi:large subunit ribosomal protein L4